MAVTIYAHNSLPVNLYVYSDRVTPADFSNVQAFLSDPRLFRGENHGITRIADHANLSEIGFSDLLSHARSMAAISKAHRQNGTRMQARFPLVLGGGMQKTISNLWIAALDLSPDYQGRFEICNTIGEAVAVTGQPETLVNDVATTDNFQPVLHP